MPSTVASRSPRKAPRGADGATIATTATRNSSVAITGIACQAVQVWLMTAPAMSVSREYHGRKSETRSSTRRPGRSDRRGGRARRCGWARLTATRPSGGGNRGAGGQLEPAATSSRMPSIASVAGER